MCGILGTINFESLPHKVYHSFMLHRGPDAQQHSKIDNVDLYHFRLAIQDLSEEANQPMNYKKFHIVFNGEIYNHIELREKYGLNCSTSSDTETILHLFELLGPKMLDEFDGMFAMAIYNASEKKVFLARDRAGKKPLYYYQKGKQFAFASEQNTLRKITNPDIDYNIINQFFFIGSQFRENTVYKNVLELENGTYLEINLENFDYKKVQWWNILEAYNTKVNIGFEESKEQFNNLFDTAIKRRIESSDLEVGTFLSGGIDSGLVTAFASKYKSKLKTFTVAFDGAYNEAPLAALVAEKFNTDHTEINIDFSNLRNDFEGIVQNYGEPFMDSSAIPSYYVSKKAKEHLTVILNGDGADELFGGYRRYVPFAKYDFFTTPNIVRKLSKVLHRVLPVSHDKKALYNYAYRLIGLMGETGVNTYLSATSDVFTGFENNFLQVPDLEKLEKTLNQVSGKLHSGLDKMMCMDFLTLLFGDLLVKMDIATMANSLEGRSPFLSKELLEFAPALPDNLKVNGKTTKFLLRQIAKEQLPIEIFNQPKRGFEIPLKSWIDNDLNDMLNDALLSSNNLYSQFIDKGFIEGLLNKRVKVSDEKRAKMLYSVLCLEIWNKENKIN